VNSCTNNSLFFRLLIIPLLCLAVSGTQVAAQEAHKNDTTSTAFYDSLKVRAEKRKFTSLLYDIVIVAPPTGGNAREKMKSTVPYEEFEGKVIRKTEVIRLDAFGSDIDDPASTDTPKGARILNKTYVKTLPFVLNRYLLFKAGDSISSLEMADNERLLRELPFIEDARIIIVPADSNTVDVAVIVKENYPYGFDFRLDDVTRGRVRLFDKNFIGLGHELALSMPYNFEDYKYPGIGIKYAIRNIAHTFSDIELEFTDGLGSTIMSGVYSRGFTTSETKYAWSASIRATFTSEDLDTMPAPVPLSFTYQDYWAARSFMLNRSTVTRLILSGRYIDNNVYRRPMIDENSYYRLQRYQLFTADLAISSQRFINTSLIYSYGRTENIPYGYMVEVLGGTENNEFKYRTYAGLKASYGNIFTRFGYLYAGFGFTTFYNHGKTEQGLVEGRMRYFTPIIQAGRSKIRTFVNLYYARGLNRYSDELLYLRNDDLIRGFRNDSITGNTRIVATFEPVLFTPRQVLGFQFAIFAFADAGFIKGGQKTDRYRTISALGAGIRIRNDRLVLNTLQIRLAWYPNPLPYSETSWFTVDGIVRLKPPGFEPGPPGVTPYQ
jgi:hypothetical protein